MEGALELYGSEQACGLAELIERAEVWENRREQASSELVKTAFYAGISCFLEALVLGVIGRAISVNAVKVAGFFWVHSVGLSITHACGNLQPLWPMLAVAGVLGAALSALLHAVPTPPVVRYAVLIVLAAAVIGGAIEAAIAALFALQLAAWIVVGLLFAAFAAAIVAGLAES